MAFSMNLPATDEVKKEVAESLEPKTETVEQVKTQAEANADAIMGVDLDSLESKREFTSAIESFGRDIIVKSTGTNSLLERRISDLSKAGGESGQVVSGLSQLELQMKDLDPSGVDFFKQGILGKLINPIRAYFAKYEKADDVIGEIIKSLSSGKATLKSDNTTLSIEQQNLRDLTKQIAVQIALGTDMDAAIEKAIAKAESEMIEQEKIKFVREEILFPLRQRLMDLQQMQAVNMQGIIAMEVIRRNNAELIRAVERAETVTIAALRTAVIVASALYNQKIVIEKIKAVNEATNTLISSTSKMLKEQGAEIQTSAMETGVSVETLKSAFVDTFDALQAISDYKTEALPRMAATVSEFRVLAEEGERKISEIERAAKLGIQKKD